MQKLWAARCDWDAELPKNLMVSWRRFCEQLLSLRELAIPRWTGQGSDTVSAEIHGFADASTAAYGAVVYLKLIELDGSVRVTLVSAKSRVAPLKPIIIPRLELCSIVLLAQLIVFVQSHLEITSLSCHCWTDSTVALAWVTQSPSQWKTFVANRVHEVQSQIPNAIWHHVASQQNPADLASRGINPDNLRPQELWWQGPAWLKLPSTQWPEELSAKTLEVLPETRMQVEVHTARAPAEWDLSARFSSWTKLLRVTVYVIRFIQNIRSRPGMNRARDNAKSETDAVPRSLKLKEINSARQFWLRSIQQQLFPKELLLLKDSRPVKMGSKLTSLNPFLDNDDLIRVGGRLRHSALDAKTKHPIVLASHPLVTLLFRHTHLQAAHADPQLTLSLLREEFWLLCARKTVRSIIFRCVPCTTERTAVATELMGDLPAYRVRPATRVFLHCGIDYAGPIQIRSTPGRGHKVRKAYIAVFICMTIKATHLEVVSDLSTSAFLAAFERFAARRGIPDTVYSDNATNFQGARNELVAVWHSATHDPNVLNLVAEKGVKAPE